MRKNNKRMLVAMLAMAMVLSMTACAEEPAEDTSSSEPESSVSEQVSEPEVSDLEVEDDTGSDTEAESSDPAADNTSSAADTGSSTASQPAADTTTSQPAADQGSSQAQQPATSGQADTSSQTQAQAPATTQTSNTSSGKGPLANYTVSVQDNSTPAVSVSGRSIDGKSGYYFYSANDDILGYIASSVVSQINRDYKMIQKTDDEQKAWYVEQFNELRGVEGGSGSSSSSSPSSSSNGSSSSDFDVDEFCEEVVRLTNIEREAAGLDPLVMDDTAMEYAQIRAEELAITYSHTRPNNESKSLDGLYFIENIAYGQKTPEEVVNDWMNSSGHKATLLGDYSDYGNRMGAGVYKFNGVIYWTQEFVGWDSQG